MLSNPRNRMRDVYFVAMSFCAGDLTYPEFAEGTATMTPIKNFKPLDEQAPFSIVPQMPEGEAMIRDWVYNTCSIFARGGYSHDAFLHEIYNAYKAYRECENQVSNDNIHVVASAE